MNNLNFKNSNSLAYSIVMIENKKYLIDLASMKGKWYFLGLLPKKITLDMIELDPSNNFFEIKSKTKLGTTTIAIMIQPLVGILYRTMKSIFISTGINQQLFIKSIIFVLPMIIAYLGTVFYEKSARRKVELQTSKFSKHYKIILKPNGKRIPVLGFGIVLNFICLVLFLIDTSGSEAAILVINGLISLFFFFIIRMPNITSLYKNKELLLVRIKEI